MQDIRCTCSHKYSEHDFDIDGTDCVPEDESKCRCTRFIEDQSMLPVLIVDWDASR